jgi:hypothetical protein
LDFPSVTRYNVTRYKPEGKGLILSGLIPGPQGASGAAESCSNLGYLGAPDRGSNPEHLAGFGRDDRRHR